MPDPGRSWHDASNWGSALGYDHTPGIGSIAWWKGRNHVAYVEQISSDGSQVFVRADNFVNAGGYTDSGWVPTSSPTGFLHPFDIQPAGSDRQSSPTVHNDGYVYHFATNATGQVKYMWRRDSDNTWRQAGWANIGDAAGTALSRPTAIATDGYMFVFARDANGHIRYTWRNDASNEWRPNGWYDLGSASGSMSAPTAIAADGDLFVFSVDGSGALRYRWRSAASGDWNTSWSSRGAPSAATLTGSLTAAHDDGYLFIFGTDSSGGIQYMWRRDSDNAWRDGYANLGTAGGSKLTSPAAYVNDNDLFIFATDQAGHLRYKWRGGTHIFDGGWTDRGAPSGSAFAQPSVMADDGYMFIFGTDTAGNVRYMWRRDSNNSWRDGYANIGTVPGRSMSQTSPIAADGILLLLANDSSGNMRYKWRRGGHIFTGDWGNRGAP